MAGSAASVEIVTRATVRKRAPAPSISSTAARDPLRHLAHRAAGL